MKSPLVPTLFTAVVIFGFGLICYMTPRDFPPAAPLPASVEQALRVAKVECEDGHGSCFPIAHLGGLNVWLTAKHVAQVEPKRVVLPNGNEYPILSVDLHPFLDVALLWTRGEKEIPIPLAARDPQPGTKIILSGYPAGLGRFLSEGMLCDTHGATWTSATIFYGCSGGPVLVDGQVVGVGVGLLLDRNRGYTPIESISAIVLVDSFRDWLREKTGTR